MPDITLLAHSGRSRGTGNARRLRHEGAIPGVVYGHGIDATPITVDGRALRAVLSTEAGVNVVIELDVDGTHHLAMAKEIQRHPVRGTVAHVDFLVVNRNEIVSVDVPVALVGEATDIKNAGGTVSHELHTLSVHCTPDRIPTAIELDVSGLTIGSALRVGDVKLPPGVTTDVDPDTVVAVGHAAVVEVEEVAEAAEGEVPAEEVAQAEEVAKAAEASSEASSGAPTSGDAGSTEG